MFQRRCDESADLFQSDGSGIQPARTQPAGSKKSTIDESDRYKIHMPASLLPNVFEAMDDQYSVLEINGIRCFHYETTYFDTDDHRFYHMHRTGRLNRFKVRVRRYVDSDVQFLEVK